MRRQAVDPANAKASFGDVQVDLAARPVKKRGEAVHLTPIGIGYRLDQTAE
jgi:hypothetical protein